MKYSCSYVPLSFCTNYALNKHEYHSHALACTDLSDKYGLKDGFHVISKLVHYGGRKYPVPFDDSTFQADGTVMEDTKRSSFLDDSWSVTWNTSELDELLNLFKALFGGTLDNVDKDSNLESTLMTVSSSFCPAEKCADWWMNELLPMLLYNTNLLSDIFNRLTYIKQYLPVCRPSGHCKPFSE